MIHDGEFGNGLASWLGCSSANGPVERSPLVDMFTRHTKFAADEPEEFGGSNQGPVSLELLSEAYLSSLGILSRVAAQEMDFELKEIETS